MKHTLTLLTALLLAPVGAFSAETTNAAERDGGMALEKVLDEKGVPHARGRR